MPESARRRLLTPLYYGLLAGALVAILLQLLPPVLPDAVAGTVARNSEGLLLALVVSLWIQWARPWLTGRRREWALTGLVAAACAVAGVLLLLSDLPSRVRTLNETFLAATALLPWLQLRRPLPRAVAVGAPLALLAAVVLLNRTALVTDLAETLGALLLFPVALDVVDRGILDPRAITRVAARWGWYVGLVAAPAVFSLLQYDVVLSGLPGEAVRYLVRITEAFVCLLVVELWFAVVLGRTGRSPASPGVRPTAEVATTG